MCMERMNERKDGRLKACFPFPGGLCNVQLAQVLHICHQRAGEVKTGPAKTQNDWFDLGGWLKGENVRMIEKKKKKPFLLCLQGTKWKEMCSQMKLDLKNFQCTKYANEMIFKNPLATDDI